MITLTLPYPPTANNMHTVARGRKIKSGEYRQWEALAGAALMGQCNRLGPITGPYNLSAVVNRPDRRRRDLSNLIKPLEDILVSCGVIRDDSDCNRLTFAWSDKAPSKDATVSVTVEPV